MSAVNNNLSPDDLLAMQFSYGRDLQVNAVCKKWHTAFQKMAEREWRKLVTAAPTLPPFFQAKIQKIEERYFNENASQKLGRLHAKLVKERWATGVSVEAFDAFKNAHRGRIDSNRFIEVAECIPDEQDACLMRFCNTPSIRDQLVTPHVDDWNAARIRERLRDNPIAFEGEAIQYFTRIELGALPPEIGKWNRLDAFFGLQFQFCNLRYIPTEIGQLTNIRGLYLHQNQLATLPRSIGNLPHLEELFLWGNPLSSLPETMGELFKKTSFKLYLHPDQCVQFQEQIERWCPGTPLWRRLIGAFLFLLCVCIYPLLLLLDWLLERCNLGMLFAWILPPCVSDISECFIEGCEWINEALGELLGSHALIGGKKKYSLAELQERRRPPMVKISSGDTYYFNVGWDLCGPRTYEVA